MRSSVFFQEVLHQLPGSKTLEDYLQQNLDTLIESTLSSASPLHTLADTDSGLETIIPLSSPALELFTLASKAPRSLQGRKVYVMEYPGYDSKRNDQDVIYRIFSNTYGVKYLQLGAITAFFEDRSILTHTCLILGGNLGSCLVDIETNKVVGLHFRDRYLILLLYGNLPLALSGKRPKYGLISPLSIELFYSGGYYGALFHSNSKSYRGSRGGLP